MLWGLQCLLSNAQKNKYAVGAFNVNSFAFADAFIKAAEEANSPLILQFSPGVLRTFKDSNVIEACASIAQDSEVPVCIHLDHAKSIDDLKLALQYHFFQSFMIDGSRYPLKENIQLTKDAIHLLEATLSSESPPYDDLSFELFDTYKQDLAADMKSFAIEAEIGHVGTTSQDLSSDTLVNDVLTFASSVDIDALAISIGNTHGESDRETNLNIPLLTTIRKSVSVPLVLHGSSGVKPQMIKEAISNGITKVNVNTYFKNSLADQIIAEYGIHGKEFFTDYKLFHPVIHSTLKAKAKEMFQLLGSVSKVGPSLYPWKKSY
ncbi:MAG: class II fructose-bisphosphate aldolase [Caldisericia bacterium]|nr:class II fructose-bisphosphate aldolase [Caldisericia bacterium]MDD4614236.1 class II fructose-bisphosphate aldolase [Caldisericia bacterium]